MTLIELIERLMPYFPQLPPEVAEFFGEILLTGDPGKVDTYDLRTIIYALPLPLRSPFHNAALSLLHSVQDTNYADHYIRYANVYLNQIP